MPAALDPRVAITRRPFVCVALVVAVVIAIEVLFGALLGRLTPGLPVLTVGIITGATLAALCAATLGRLGWWRELGFTRPARPRALLWFLPFLLYGLLPLTAGVRASGGAILAGAVAGLLIAFWKLTVLGLLLRAVLPGEPRRAAALAASCYAAMHLGGLLVGAAVAPTLLLSLSYLFLAFAFAAVRLRTGVLWPLVGCYALLLTTGAAAQDTAAPNLVASVESILPAVIASLLLAAYGLFALPRQPRVADAEWGEASYGQPSRA